jgi:hypothetical protein
MKKLFLLSALLFVSSSLTAMADPVLVGLKCHLPEKEETVLAIDFIQKKVVAQTEINDVILSMDRSERTHGMPELNVSVMKDGKEVSLGVFDVNYASFAPTSELGTFDSEYLDCVGVYQ